ncbi:MAG: HNH endonuclease [Deltaproteobacteria bacterium]|nr:HNH endonuclease [Deltaproteobacteria bacterium]
MFAETLVLDPGWTPVARINWQRAVTLLWEGKVEVIEEYEDRVVRSMTLEIQVPSVIRFLRGHIGRKRAIRFSRQNVFVRDGGRCQYCRARVARPEATYDHVVPRVMGGRTCWENVVIACMACNQRKGGRTPVQARMRLGTLPVKPDRLPGGPSYFLTFQRGMPESWRAYLRDAVASLHYWNDELEQDA